LKGLLHPLILLKRELYLIPAKPRIVHLETGLLLLLSVLEDLDVL